MRKLSLYFKNCHEIRTVNEIKIIEAKTKILKKNGREIRPRLPQTAGTMKAMK